MITFSIKQSSITNNILIPKYYDPEIQDKIENLREENYIFCLGDLIEQGLISYSTGHEIGKSAYGTGNIPFVRTSDISNWEIKTAPKQGVSEEIFQEFSKVQDVQDGDILLVRDGTYLVGTNCFITEADSNLIFQSHILKLRVEDGAPFSSEEFFLSLNNEIVQRQIKSIQFTADIIDTIGNRFKEINIPIPKDKEYRKKIAKSVREALDKRVIGKVFIKDLPVILEEILKKGDASQIEYFEDKSFEKLKEEFKQDTISMEFGKFEATFISKEKIEGNVLLPKYYDPEIEEEIRNISEQCDIETFGELEEKGKVRFITGDEPGKMAYGDNGVPFIRTSDFANWELKHDPKHQISWELYEKYKIAQDVRKWDILLVRDGTYLVGSSTIILEDDINMVFCGGLYKISSEDWEFLDPFLLLGLLNSYVVKRQIRSKQFTRDVIDTLGKRIREVRLPIPKDKYVKEKISSKVKEVVTERYSQRNKIQKLSRDFI